MRYTGSKRRIFKYIKPFLRQHVYNSDYYYEPFVGGANSLVNFDWYSEISRIAWDINPYLIAMWNELRLGWEPPIYVTEEQYQHIKENKDRYEPSLVGYVGILYSFGGTWFKGYANEVPGKINYETTAKNLILQGHKLKDVKFECRDFFRDWGVIRKNSIVYCDPPYKKDGVRGYISDKYDYNVYRELSRKSFVYISELAGCMPSDFALLMYRPIVYMNKGVSYRKVECLYTYVEGLAYANQSLVAKLQSEAIS